MNGRVNLELLVQDTAVVEFGGKAVGRDVMGPSADGPGWRDSTMSDVCIRRHDRFLSLLGLSRSRLREAPKLDLPSLHIGYLYRKTDIVPIMVLMNELWTFHNRRRPVCCARRSLAKLSLGDSRGPGSAPRTQWLCRVSMKLKAAQSVVGQSRWASGLAGAGQMTSDFFCRAGRSL